MLGDSIEGSEGDVTSHMSSRMTGRIAVIARVSGRRRWTVEQKLGMLRDAFGSEGCVSTAMDRHEVSSGQLYTWRRQAMSGELTGNGPPIAKRQLPPAVQGGDKAGHWSVGDMLMRAE